MLPLAMLQQSNILTLIHIYVHTNEHYNNVDYMITGFFYIAFRLLLLFCWKSNVCLYVCEYEYISVFVLIPRTTLKNNFSFCLCYFRETLYFSSRKIHIVFRQTNFWNKICWLLVWLAAVRMLRLTVCLFVYLIVWLYTDFVVIVILTAIISQIFSVWKHALFGKHLFCIKTNSNLKSWKVVKLFHCSSYFFSFFLVQLITSELLIFYYSVTCCYCLFSFFCSFCYYM